MAITPFLRDRVFDPETIQVMNAAFLAVCGDLGLNDKTDSATEMVAIRIIELTDGQLDSQTIRAAVLTSFKTPH
jgi:hypothetical protein